MLATTFGSTVRADNTQPVEHPRGQRVDDPFVSPAPEDDGAHKTLTLEISPIGALVGHYGGSIELVPLHHHALIASPFFYSSRTGVVPTTLFRGFGLELGYRYYSGARGPRGLFIGPSLLLGFYNATPSPDPTLPATTAQPLHDTFFQNFGVALDVGYQAVVADKVVIGIGAGAQYTYVTKSFANQQWPTNVHSNANLFPRALLSFGWAFD